MQQNEHAIYDYVVNTFRAYAEAMIPHSPGLAEQYGRIQFYGALESYTAEYLMMSLDSYLVPLAIPAAETLNMAARLYLQEMSDSLDFSEDPEGLYFMQLPPVDRLNVVDRLSSPDGIVYIPAGLSVRQEDVVPVISALNRLTMMGYYSEWSGYGSTRLMPPTRRVLEYWPISWEQVGYPGPSLGYRVAGAFAFAQKE